MVLKNMPRKAKKTVEAGAGRHEKIFQILNDVQAELSSSDDEEEMTTAHSLHPCGQSEPTDPKPPRSGEMGMGSRGQSELTDKKRPRSEAQMASLARAQQSAKEKRRIRDKQREVEKVTSIA